MDTTDLKNEVAQLVAEIDKTHRYSMSRIYELSNKVFDSHETPQSCASCLIRKVRRLKKWLETVDREQLSGNSEQVTADNKPSAAKSRQRKTRNL